MNNDLNGKLEKSSNLVTNNINLGSKNIQSFNITSEYINSKTTTYNLREHQTANSILSHMNSRNHNLFNSMSNPHNSVNLSNQNYQKNTSSSHSRDILINMEMFERLLNFKLSTYKLKFDNKENNEEIKIALLRCLETYLRNRYDELLRYTRSVNVNFDKYAKTLEKKDFLAVKCYHKDMSIRPLKFELTMFPIDKEKLARLEQYEELISCKERFDKKVKRIILGKQLENQINNKSAENSNNNPEEDAEGQINSTSKNTVTINFANKNPRGRPQTRLKDSSQLKMVRKENTHLKLKESEYNRKLRTEDTLDFFAKKTKANTHEISEFDDQMSRQGDFYNNMDNKDDSNSKDINLIIHTRGKYNLSFPIQYKITLKDYYAYLEKRVRYTYQQKILLKVFAKLITCS